MGRGTRKTQDGLSCCQQHLPSQKPPTPLPQPYFRGGSSDLVEPSTDRPSSEGGPCLISPRPGATRTVGAQGRPVAQHGLCVGPRGAAGQWSPWESSGSPQWPDKVLGSLLTLQPDSHVHAARTARDPRLPALGCFGGPSSHKAWPTGLAAPWPVNPCSSPPFGPHMQPRAGASPRGPERRARLWEERSHPKTRRLDKQSQKTWAGVGPNVGLPSARLDHDTKGRALALVPEGPCPPSGVGAGVAALATMNCVAVSLVSFCPRAGGRVQGRKVITRLLPGRGGSAGVARAVAGLDVEAPVTWAELERPSGRGLPASPRGAPAGELRPCAITTGAWPGPSALPGGGVGVSAPAAALGDPRDGKPGTPKNPTKPPAVQTCTPDLTAGGEAS